MVSARVEGAGRGWELADARFVHQLKPTGNLAPVRATTGRGCLGQKYFEVRSVVGQEETFTLFMSSSMVS
ncbi:hypothetical protein GCM10009733_061750 [Nonomuraea maheshkhaliensis]|uniref:Uncharacterized protein n=1 Tax=Nonomuraea maheshkhaliensis TaxID=419590 RepID=A0ABN2FPL6_9ACTN